jgi:hypothetical protein
MRIAQGSEFVGEVDKGDLLVVYTLERIGKSSGVSEDVKTRK